MARTLRNSRRRRKAQRGLQAEREPTLVLTRQVPLQIHAVVQQPQHFDHFAMLSIRDAEQNEMACFASISCGMESTNLRADFRPPFHTNEGWTST